MLRQRQLPAFNGIPASLASGARTTVTCKLDLGTRVHAIHLEFGSDGATNPGEGLGTLAAPGMIDEIRLLVDGKVQRRMTAVELNALNLLMSVAGTTEFAAQTSGTANAAGFRTRLSIFLAEVWRKGAVIISNQNVLESTFSAWNLVGIKSCSIEVDLIGRKSTGVNGIVDTPVIEGCFEYDAPIRSDLGTIVKWLRPNLGITSEVRDLPVRSGSYQSIHLFPTTDPKYITSLKLTLDGEEIRQDVKRFQNDLILRQRGMNPTALDTTSATTKTNTGLYNGQREFLENLAARMNRDEVP